LAWSGATSDWLGTTRIAERSIKPPTGALDGKSMSASRPHFCALASSGIQDLGHVIKPGRAERSSIEATRRNPDDSYFAGLLLIAAN
jgi:hypothetical protein